MGMDDERVYDSYQRMGGFVVLSWREIMDMIKYSLLRSLVPMDGSTSFTIVMT